MTERSPRPARRARRSPMPVISAALASFLVVLTLLTARVVTGVDRSIAPGPQAQVVSRNGHTIVRTTASGRRIVESAAPGSATEAPLQLTTRSSGGVTDD